MRYIRSCASNRASASFSAGILCAYEEITPFKVVGIAWSVPLTVVCIANAAADADCDDDDDVEEEAEEEEEDDDFLDVVMTATH